MISEFQDLSDKIDRLAQLTQSLRAENYLLRQANHLLSVENIAFKELDQLPAPEGDAADAGLDAGEPNEASQ